MWLSKSKSKSHCDWRSVSQYVLVSSPNLGLLTIDFFSQSYCLVLFGAPSLTRGRVCHVSVFVIKVYSSLSLSTKYLHLNYNFGIEHIYNTNVAVKILKVYIKIKRIHKIYYQHIMPFCFIHTSSLAAICILGYIESNSRTISWKRMWTKTAVANFKVLT
jgi:hypothetical protein